MIAYFGGKQPSSREEGMEQMSKWKAWIDSLGDRVINPGTPLLNTKVVTSSTIEDDNNPDSLNGFAVVKTETMDEAVGIAKTDPFLNNGGTIRVSEMMEMS